MRAGPPEDTLPPERRADLDTVVTDARAAVEEALGDPRIWTAGRPGTGVYCLALTPADDEDDFRPAALEIADARDRARAAAQPAGYDRIVATWGGSWSGYAFLRSGPPADSPVAAASRRLHAALEDLAAEEPARWVLNHVARDLTARPPALDVAPDFVAIVLDPDCEDDLRDTLDFILPADRLADLERRGLLPEREPGR